MVKILTIRDHNKNEYPLLAVKTVTEDLNSNPVLELKIPKQKNNNLDLKLIDKLWEINYQTVDYKIMYVKQVTKGDSFYLDVRAIPLFYWDFDKQIVHENKDGHYTGTNAFTDLFDGTGYQYVLVDFVEAIQIEGYGKGETRLEMFKRLIERFGLEFYIVGKTVYLRKLIGNDTNFQYRYKLNASNVSKSIDASNYFTHIKGFGNFEEGSENYLKDAKLKREYTSPLSSVLGKYEGKPIVDGRIKDTATMDLNLKRAVEESLEISIEGNLHDVRSIYAEAVPTIGDRVFLIDERIDLEQEIRIHTLKRTYDVHDKLIDCEVTFGSQNIRDRYKSNLNSAAKDFTALMKGAIKLPTWSLDEIARGMITKIHASENELRYGDFGIQAIDKNNPNNVFGLNSQGWYISTDGGATARTIATADGIVADAITSGSMLANFIKGGELSSISGSMVLDLNNNKFEFYTGAKTNYYGYANIQFHTMQNSLFAEMNGTTAFLNFMNSINSKIPAVVIGASENGTSAGFKSFVGMKAQSSKATPLGLSQLELIGDRIVIDGHGGEIATGAWIIDGYKEKDPIRSIYGSQQDVGYQYNLGRLSNPFEKIYVRHITDGLRVIYNSDTGDTTLMSRDLRNGILYSNSGLQFVYGGETYQFGYLLSELKKLTEYDTAIQKRIDSTNERIDFVNERINQLTK